jgi:hypothetical protein
MEQLSRLSYAEDRVQMRRVHTLLKRALKCWIEVLSEHWQLRCNVVRLRLRANKRFLLLSLALLCSALFSEILFSRMKIAAHATAVFIASDENLE